MLSNIEWNEQKRLLDETAAIEILQQFPIQRRYIVQFLRFIIDTLERQSIEIHDDLYSKLCEAQSQADTDYSYKHYKIDSDVSNESIRLKENRNKISQGTTGLNVWESAMALSELAVRNKSMFQNKEIVELGAGIGFSSIAIGKYCSPKKITITDGNDKVLEILNENVANNFVNNRGRYCHEQTGASIGKSFFATFSSYHTFFERFLLESFFLNVPILKSDC